MIGGLFVSLGGSIPKFLCLFMEPLGIEYVIVKIELGTLF